MKLKAWIVDAPAGGCCMQVMSDLTIDNAVLFEHVPKHYARIVPFSVTIHATEGELSIAEKSKIKDAIANVGHEIRRMRNLPCGDPFFWTNVGLENI